MSGSLPYVARIANVREVILHGVAQANCWRERLRARGLVPFDQDGCAEVAIGAASLEWMGLRFCELTVSVSLKAGEGASARGGYYLAGAYNTSRPLAFAERAFFQTPYRYGQVAMEATLPCVHLSDGAGVRVAARMREAAPCLWSGDEWWEGAVHLPGSAPGASRLFYARLGGHTEVYPFSPADTLVLRPGARDPALRALLECGFVPREWRVRLAATHARSRTTTGARLAAS